MTRFILIIALSCSKLTAYAEVINGFKQKKLILERDMNDLYEIMIDVDDHKTNKTLQKRLNKLQKEFEIVNKKYSETEELIRTFQIVDPELFARASVVTNAEGTLTNVIVRYVSRVSKEFTYFTSKFYKADAYTSVRQAKDCEHVCSSLSGTNTITITIGYGCNEILALGHELAHVLYIVPNLKEYTDFWNRNQEFCNGHSKSDPSYFIIQTMEEDFQRNYVSYMKQNKSNISRKEYNASIALNRKK